MKKKELRKRAGQKIFSCFMAAVLLAGTVSTANIWVPDERKEIFAADNEDVVSGTPYVVKGERAEYDVSVPHIVINQIAGANKSSVPTNGFIELYNPTDTDVDLTGWSVQYKSCAEGGNADGWVKCDLSGVIPSHCSYLVRGKQENASGTFSIMEGDIEWDVSIYTKGISVVLLSNQDLLPADSVPFDNETKKPTVDGYVDMAAVNGNDSEEAQKAPAYEGAASDVQSKKKGIRRLEFQDTDDNSVLGDFEMIDYSVADDNFVKWVQPKNVSYGAWEASTRPVLGQTTELSSDKPNTLTNTIGTDAGTTRTFTWQMPKAFTEGSVKICKDEAMTQTVSETTATVEVNTYDNAFIFRANATGLEAGTTYYYQIINGEMMSDVYSFKTYDNQSYTFIHASDTQALRDSEFAVAGNALRTVVNAYHPEFIVETGDLINTQNSEDEWRWFFGNAQDVLSKYAFFPVVGNHEQNDSYDAVSFREHFTMSNTCTAEGVTPGTVYSYDYGPAHFVVINTEDKKTLSQQAAWADQDMQATDKDFIILMAHRGLYGARGTLDDVIEAFGNVIDKNEVDLVLQGHDHSYIRTTIKNGQPSKDGTVYLESGGSGVKQVSHEDDRPDYAEITADPGKPAFSVITVSDTQIIVHTITVDENGTISPLEDNENVIKADSSMTVDFTINVKKPHLQDTTSDVVETTTDSKQQDTSADVVETTTNLKQQVTTDSRKETTTQNKINVGTTKVKKAVRTKNNKKKK